MIFSFASQAQKNVYFNKLQESNGLYLFDGVPYTGVSLERHDTTKKKKIEIHWKDGKPHGTKTTWYKDEKLKQTMNFDMDRKHGEYVSYYHNGNVKERGTYHYDTIHGKVEAFYENGKAKFVFNYAKGTKEGLQELFFENGQKEQSVTIRNSKMEGTFRTWYPDGTPMKEINYQNGRFHGMSKRWHIDGSIAEEGEYIEGKKHGKHASYEVFVKAPLKVESYNKGKKEGTWITYGLEGDTTLLANYKNDELHGEYIEKREGKIESKGNYVNGKREGYWVLNMVTLIGAQEGTFKLGVKVGDWKLYDMKGQHLATITFNEEGDIVDEWWYGLKKIKVKPKE